MKAPGSPVTKELRSRATKELRSPATKEPRLPVTKELRSPVTKELRSPVTKELRSPATKVRSWRAVAQARSSTAYSCSKISRADGTFLVLQKSLTKHSSATTSKCASKSATPQTPSAHNPGLRVQ